MYEKGKVPLSRGLLATLMREVPFSAINFFTFHYLCLITGADENNELDFMKLLFAGATCGVLGALPVYPIDVIKTRIQMDGMGENKYNGIIDCVRKTYYEEGWRVFFRGTNAMILRFFPENAVVMTTYTWFMHQAWMMG